MKCTPRAPAVLWSLIAKPSGRCPRPAASAVCLPEAARIAAVSTLNQPDFPQGPGFAWHLNPQYSQLEAARASIANPQPVRIAILDVGFDFQHHSMPEHLRRDLERNFTGDGRTDASDPDIGGFLNNPGHGTATIAILAGGQLQQMRLPTPSGSYLGGAPQAEVVPIRIATSVVLLSTSAFAEAMEYLLSLQGDPDTAIDVVSMSMGGVASDAWADVVNRAYEAGLCLVTAAGNNFGRPKSIVFPARFRRVLAACGVMADFHPYDLGFGQMSGNYGPDSKMDTAMAAFTPNMPWAEIGAPDVIDWDGQGTSSATPQVAAAAALWLQQHKAAVASWQGWEKVEIIRQALYESADASQPDSRTYFGRGILKAHNALGIEPTSARRQALRKQAMDSAEFAFWRLLRGTVFTVVTEESPLDHMFELELAQLIHRDGTVEATIADPERGPSSRNWRHSATRRSRHPICPKPCAGNWSGAQAGGPRLRALLSRPAGEAARSGTDKRPPAATVHRVCASSVSIRPPVARWIRSTSTRPS